ncbi:MAG: hypothetical protein GF368_03500, partial [Candidatus Aenigmarchaeota archaeon]|nr:hypothetical protein [Candidatus Aenigmarchaeota archaeon]
LTVNTSGLVGYWRLESFNSTNGTDDYSGYGNDGVGYGFDTDPASTVSGRFEQGVDFDGSNDYIKYDNSDFSGEVSVVLWTKMGSAGQSEWTGIFSTSDDGSLAQSFQIDLDGSNNYRLEEGESNNIIFGPASITEYSFLAVSIDSTDGLKLYMNGTEVNSDADVTSGQINVFKVGVNRGDSLYYDGVVDEIMIFNRSLSADEIKELYESRVNYGTVTTFTGTCPEQLTCGFYRNTTDKLSAENGTSLTIPAGYHYYVFNTSGNANYTRSSILLPLNVDRAIPSFSTSVSSSLDYGNPSDYSGSESNSVDSDCTYELLRNGSSIDSGSSVSDTTNLAADAYNYTYYTSGCTNFTFGSDESFLTVNKVSSSISVDFLPSSSETYGTETTSTCSIDSGDSTATLTLFRNESQIIQGSGNQNEQLTLAAAIWNYSCTYDESENYTSSSTLNNYLTISKASPVVNLLLNGTDGDRNYNVTSVINSTIELTTPSGTSENVNLDTNITGWTLDSGTTSHENMTSISTIGVYNFTGFWNGSENYTSGFETHYVTIGQPAYLEVVLVNPPSTLSVTRETNFTVNATVYCRDGSCGNVQGTVRYNLSSVNPDTPVNTSSGDSPLYVQDSPQSALKSCGTNPLAQDEYCNISWVINATGLENSGWELGVLFNSTASGISDNHTTNATITITHCSCDITLWSPAEIDFGTLNPNTDENTAAGNSANDYNITVNEGSCDSNLWIKGEDLTNSTYGTTISIGNVTWSNSTDDYSSSYNMTTDYSLINMSVGERKRITTYYWINTPIILAGKYTGNVTIFANETE